LTDAGDRQLGNRQVEGPLDEQGSCSCLYRGRGETVAVERLTDNATEQRTDAYLARIMIDAANDGGAVRKLRERRGETA